MSTVTTSTNNNNHQSTTNPDRAARGISRYKEKLHSQQLDEATAELKSLTDERDQLYFEFNLLAEVHGHHTVAEGDVPPPTEFAEHRRKYNAYFGTEIVCYFVSLLLLAAQTWLTLSYEWPIKVAIVVAGFLVVWQLFPAIILTAFEVDQRRKDSIKPVKVTLLLAAIIATGGVIAFAVTRSSDDESGAWVVVYNNALVAAEIGFAICGACAQVMKDFYSWSILQSRRYLDLEQGVNEASRKVFELTPQSVGVPQQPIPSGKEDHHDNVH